MLINAVKDCASDAGLPDFQPGTLNLHRFKVRRCRACMLVRACSLCAATDALDVIPATAEASESDA